jgi:hypothetical protein
MSSVTSGIDFVMQNQFFEEAGHSFVQYKSNYKNKKEESITSLLKYFQILHYNI